jgi:PAS domain S-box-containing protein
MAGPATSRTAEAGETGPAQESWSRNLRGRAEQEAEKQVARLSATLDGLSPEAAARLLHELQVHQIELELQNAELRSTEVALAASRERYFRLYDLAPVGYLSLDGAGLILEANLAAAALLAAERHELLHRPWTEFIAAEDQDNYHLQRRALQRTEAVSCELALRTRDARPRWVRLDMKRAPGAGHGDLACWVALSDITERRQTEQALAELQAELAALHDGGLLVTLLVDAQMQGRNLQSRDSLQGSPGQTSGAPLLAGAEAKFKEALRSPHELHSSAGADRERCGECALREAVTSTLRTRERQHQVEITLGLPGADGRASDRTFLLSTAYLTVQQSPRVLVFAVDITARRRLMAELAHAQKMQAIGNLAGGVAHEFNNTLAVLVANAEFLESELRPDTPAAEYLASIVAATHRASQVTRQLLAYSRKQVSAPRAVDLRLEVPRLEKLLREHLTPGITLRFEFSETLATVHVDPTQLEQVLVNLTVNARDAMPSGGEVVLRADNVQLRAGDADRPGPLAPGSYIRLQVSDSGSGMSRDVAAQVFEPFFTTKPFGKGTGLGLAIVHGIVAQSGGHIAVESAPDQGTRFIVHLPRGLDMAAPPLVPDAPPAPRARRWSGKVLLVEDEPLVLAPVRRLLLAQGFQVDAAASGEEAIEKFASHLGDYRFVLTDVAMPGMSGLALARQLIARRPELQVLLMSGCPDEPAAQEGTPGDNQHFIAKPFGAKELAAAIGALLTPSHA